MFTLDDPAFLAGMVDPLWILAGAAPTFDLPFGRNKSLVDAVTGQNLITFTRAYEAIFTGPNGLLKTAGNGVPVFDHDPITRACLGLRIEEQRVNRLLHNRDLTQADWVATNITPAKDQIGADGVSNSASSITSTAGNGTILQTITHASAARATSAYVKRVTGSGAIEMTQNGGTTWTAVTVTGDWTRVQIPSATVTNPVVGFRIVASGDAIAVDYAQCENGTDITSPIATGAATVTRAADVPSISGTNFSSWYNQSEGTVFAETIYNSDTSGATAFFNDASYNNLISLQRDPTLDRWQVDYFSGGSRQGLLNLQTSTAPTGIATKAATSYKVDNFNASANGGAIISDASGLVPVGITRVSLGFENVGGAYANCTIRRFTYWPQRLPNPTLQTITQ